MGLKKTFPGDSNPKPLRNERQKMNPGIILRLFRAIFFFGPERNGRDEEGGNGAVAAVIATHCNKEEDAAKKILKMVPNGSKWKMSNKNDLKWERFKAIF